MGDGSRMGALLGRVVAALRSGIRHAFGRRSARGAGGNREMVVDLVGMVASTPEEEIGCDEVFQLLDQYAEIVARGEDPAPLLPLVRRHLESCGDCREELEALLRVLQPTRPNIDSRSGSVA